MVCSVSRLARSRKWKENMKEDHIQSVKVNTTGLYSIKSEGKRNTF